MALVAEAYENFIGGQLSSVPANEVGPNQLVKCENALVTDRDKPGILVKRKGYSKHWDESGTYTTGVRAIHNWIKSDGTETLLFAVENGTDTEIRKRTGPTTSSLVATYAGTNRTVTIVTAPTDVAIIAVEGSSPNKYDGTTVAGLGAPTTANTGVMTVHDGRVWVSDGSTKNLLHFSAVMDEDNWTAPDNAGNITMKMPGIVGLVSAGSSGLVVCDEFSTILIVGDDYQSYRQREMSRVFGCKSYKSMVSFGNFALWLSHEGVVAVSEAGLEKVSLPIEDIIDGMSDAAKKGAKAFRWKEQYVLCYDSDNDGLVDKAVMFDTRYGIWTQHTPFRFSGGTAALDETTYVANDQKGVIYTFASGTTDDGSAVAMNVITRGFDFGRFFDRKIPRRAYFQSNKPGTITNLSVQLKVDGSNVGVAQNYDLNKGEDDMSFVDSGSGQIIQLELTNSGLTDEVELRSIVLLANMQPSGEVP